MEDHVPPTLESRDLTRIFESSAGEVHACTDVNIAVHPGELLVVRGKSGSGKTTLLNLLGGLDTPTSGEVIIEGQSLGQLNDRGLTEVRRNKIGYVFQTFGLIPVLSASENIEIPLRIRGVSFEEREAKVAEILDLVGLTGHAAQRPFELSGGQQQRVGLARALVAEPRILIADEPTGQLDSRTAAVIMDLIQDFVTSKRIAAVLSTHDPLMVARAHNVLDLHDGKVTNSEHPRGRHSVPIGS
ncbi:MAG: ABC transporter ATP-binding protein [Microbacteriaceae bacterium]|nr:ABC transporter ATP-binding protein [Cryobacterium sp.]MCC6375655.1 ABC transporter ATP-binding protein [Microbacteriaceae bacterium]